MRCVIYARYSSDNQREESIEGQICENTAYAQKNGIDIVGTYIDRAYSAKTDNRPEFQSIDDREWDLSAREQIHSSRRCFWYTERKLRFQTFSCPRKTKHRNPVFPSRFCF